MSIVYVYCTPQIPNPIQLSKPRFIKDRWTWKNSQWQMTYDMSNIFSLHYRILLYFSSIPNPSVWTGISQTTWLSLNENSERIREISVVASLHLGMGRLLPLSSFYSLVRIFFVVCSPVLVVVNGQTDNLNQPPITPINYDLYHSR